MEKKKPVLGLPLTYGRITLRPMTRQDVDEMALWPFHLDPFYARGARLPSTSGGRNRWWKEHNKGEHSTLLGTDDENGRLIGRVSVSLVDKGAKEGVMGIRIRPEYENRGYGTELIIAFLEYWFFVREMEVLSFDANVLNKRAIRCYEKVGLPLMGYHYEYQPQFLLEPEMNPSGFIKHLDYRITRKQLLDLLKLQNDESPHPV